MVIWDYLVHIHRVGDIRALVIFWGCVAALIVFVILQILLARAKGVARRALGTARDASDEVRRLVRELDELERRMEKRLDARARELDERMTKKLDQKGDLVQERIEQRAGSLSDDINGLEGRVRQAEEDVAGFRRRVKDVENRIPNLFDRLDEFRETLGKTFQAELGSVLNSFDNSVSSILSQMKSELQMGISRIEGIENMVRSRESAEHSLLAPGLPEAAPQQESTEKDEQSGFEAWEEEAKQLAEEEALDDELADMVQAAAEAEEDELQVEEEEPEVEEPEEELPGTDFYVPDEDEEDEDDLPEEEPPFI
ncbi:MAG: hypothetical protein R6V05_02970 [Candidatus Brocadiia bacterium]